LVNKDKYSIDYNSQMDPADEKLLEEDILAPQDSIRYNFTSIYYLFVIWIILLKTKSLICFVYDSSKWCYLYSVIKENIPGGDAQLSFNNISSDRWNGKKVCRTGLFSFEMEYRYNVTLNR